MRKLRLIEHISLDGVIQVSGEDGDFPYGDWTAPYRTPAGRDAILAAHGIIRKIVQPLANNPGRQHPTC